MKASTLSPFKVSLNSWKDSPSRAVEEWSIPESLESFRMQFKGAFEERNAAPHSELWDMSKDSLAKAGENWEYFITHFKEYWVTTLIDNARSQIWCEKFDELRPTVGEQKAREAAVGAVDAFYRRFHILAQTPPLKE